MEEEAGDLGVRKATGVSCSDLIVTRRPKWVSEPTRVLKSEKSSLEAEKRRVRSAEGSLQNTTRGDT